MSSRMKKGFFSDLYGCGPRVLRLFPGVPESCWGVKGSRGVVYKGLFLEIYPPDLKGLQGVKS